MIKNTSYSFISIMLLVVIVSCTPRHVEIPSFPELNLNSHLAELSNIHTIEAVLQLEYEKGTILMNGDASLTLSENSLDLKVYYLGFLAGYIKENNGIVSVSQKIDKNKSLMLIEGLKNSFMWWKINNHTIEDEGEFYKFQNYNRKIFLDKKTLLPAQQLIELYNGDELKILYDSPAKIDNTHDEVLVLSPAAMWYQSNMRISLNNQLLKIKIKSYTVRTKGDLNDKKCGI